jgi:hypothetical protein
MGMPDVSSLNIINTQKFVKRGWTHEEAHCYQARKGNKTCIEVALSRVSGD